MRSTISCSACGTVLGVPKAGFPADGLPCNWCGYVNVQAPEPAAAPARAKSLPAPVDPELPEWSDDEDDSKPYALPAEEAKTRPCVSCGKQIDLLAVVCVHCGYDYESGRKVERTFQPIDKEWAAGWSLR